MLAGLKRKSSHPDECLDKSRKGQVQIPAYYVQPSEHPVMSTAPTNTPSGLAPLAGFEEAEVRGQSLHSPTSFQEKHSD